MILPLLFWLNSTIARSPSAVSVTPDFRQRLPTAERRSADTPISFAPRKSSSKRFLDRYKGFVTIEIAGIYGFKGENLTSQVGGSILHCILVGAIK